MLYDVHAHIDLYEDRNNVISYIENEKIHTIAMTNLPEIYEKYQREYQSLKYVKFALGFHPELVSQYYSQIDDFLKLLPNAKYIGEIGLDFSRGKTSEEKSLQIKVFNDIMTNCKKYADKKILNIHTRNAVEDAIEIINGYHGKVIMHWFSGRLFDLRKAINIGCYFSINNQMVDTRQGEELIKLVPMNKILLETDAPFTKMSRSKYSIKCIDYVLKRLSFIRNMNNKDTINELLENYYSLVATEK